MTVEIQAQLGLPSTWDRVPAATVEFARQHTLEALAGVEAEGRLRTYFNAQSDYSGTLFNELDPDAPQDEITTGDLLAVGSLSIDITARQIRALHMPGDSREEVRSALGRVPAGVSLGEIGCHLDQPALSDASALLTRMESLHAIFRRSAQKRGDGSDSNRWVFAAKLAARKRPELFPVRDRVVCEYLSATGRMTSGGLGTFRTDIQVFAHLMADEHVVSLLRALVRAVPEVRATPPLRVLDVALWMAGRGD